MSNNSVENRHEEFLTLVERQIQVLEERRSQTTSSRYDDLLNFLDVLITEAEYIDESQVKELSVWYSLALLTIQCIYEYETNPESFGMKALVLIELLADLPKVDEYSPTLVEPMDLADNMKAHRAEVLAPYLDEDGNIVPNDDLTTLQTHLDEIIGFVENLDEEATTLLVSTVLNTIWKLLHIVEKADSYQDDEEYSSEESEAPSNPITLPGDSYEERLQYSNFILTEGWRYLVQFLKGKNVDPETTFSTSTHTNDADSNTAIIIGNMLSFLLSNQKLKA